MKNQKTLLDAAIILACAIILLVSGAAFLAWPQQNSSAGVKHSAGRAQRPNADGPSDTPQPDSAEYGWLQFASYLENQHLSLGSQSPPPPDPDWTVVDQSGSGWQTKSGLGLGSEFAPCLGLENVAAMAAVVRKSASRSLIWGEVPFRQFAKGLESPPELANIKAATPMPSCTGVLQRVLYNSVASATITNLSLNSQQTLRTMLAGGQQIQFPNHSVIVKEIWEQVQKDETIIDWEPDNSELTAHETNESYSLMEGWGTSLTVDPSNQSMRTSASSHVPVSAFVHRTFTDAANAPNFVLVGLNIAHKINGHWYWFTFAWKNMGAASGSCSNEGQDLGMSLCGKPAYLDAWNDYLMNRTDALSDPTGTSTCLNPYLEGQGPKGLVSNCIRCHQFAAYGWRQTDPGFSVAYGASPTPFSQADVQKFMQGALSTDFLWSISQVSAVDSQSKLKQRTMTFSSAKHAECPEVVR
ncbi:MAG TPA: hypothetical protein VMU80_04105 [Bryobacteraceae bacterium]|nr:hypothetical protein [Bryobacteraceae bacterium]